MIRQTLPSPITLQLQRDLRRTLKRGHPWVFADNLRQRPKAPPGTPAILLDNRKREVARGFYDADSPLAFRVCTLDGEKLNNWWATRQCQRALQLRQTIVPAGTSGYRLFNGEGDGLPGLVCDIYDNTAVLRLDGAAAAQFWDTSSIANWLHEKTNVACVYVRNRLPQFKEQCALGKPPSSPIQFLENGIRFAVDVVQGQKTGFFLDQRNNRQQIRQVARGKRVLNMFGYTGGFSVYAGMGGATHVSTVDVARPAIEAAAENWQLNSLPNERHAPIVSDAFAFLEQARQQQERWDIVIIDPPSFAPSQEAVPKAIKAYQTLISAAAAVTTPDGIVAASSCSSHIDQPMFLQACEEGISQARRQATILSLSGQPADHPTPLVFSEFRYLKFVLMRVT